MVVSFNEYRDIATDVYEKNAPEGWGRISEAHQEWQWGFSAAGVKKCSI